MKSRRAFFYVAAIEAAFFHYLLELASYIGHDLDEVFWVAAEERRRSSAIGCGWS
jgi:hypothetical protein